nr:glycine-rich cell wall structural protein 2-like [Lolium perenne]
MAASHCGSRRAARAEPGRGDGVDAEGAEVDAVQTYSSEGYRVLGTRIPARARVRGPVAGGGGGSGGAGGEASHEASPGEDGRGFEGDASGVEAGEPGKGASPGEDGAAPELRLEGDAGGVGAGVGAGVGVGSPETWLEGDPEGGEAAPETEFKGAAENVEAVPESELEGTAAGRPAGGRRRGLSVVEGYTSGYPDMYLNRYEYCCTCRRTKDVN